jgi:APA family basic amino acid/polyamine antiporter
LNLWARKPVEELCAEAGVAGEVSALPRSIGVFALTCIGVGGTVGAGIFVLTGNVAAEHSGPAVGLSLLLASIVCLLAGLCYSELAAMIPVAGSAYSYTYATLGEGIAWTVGWCLMLEYLFAASLVAISWAGYATSTLHQLGVDLSRMPGISTARPPSSICRPCW